MGRALVGKAAFAAAGLSVASALTFSLRPAPASPPPSTSTFVGTSPCGAALKSGLDVPLDNPCEVVVWNLTLRRDAGSLEPTTYDLSCEFGVPEQGSTELSARKGTVRRGGKWTAARGSAIDPRAVVYRLDSAGKAPLYLQRVAANLLHVLDRDGRPMVGNAGWSYTLNVKAGQFESLPPDAFARAGAMFDSAQAANRASPVAVTAFVGRTPGFNEKEHPKIKWDIALSRDPKTRRPTTFTIKGTLYREKDCTGVWLITKGIPGDAEAVVYELTSDNERAKYQLLHLSEGVLLFLDEEKRPIVGNRNYSFTLNRAEASASE